MIISEEKIINSIYLTKQNDFSPIISYQVKADGIHLNVHVQVIHISFGKRYTISLAVTDHQTGKEVISANNWFEINSPSNTGRGYGDVVTPLDLDKKDIQGLSEISISAKISEDKQSVILLLKEQNQ